LPARANGASVASTQTISPSASSGRLAARIAHVAATPIAVPSARCVILTGNRSSGRWVSSATVSTTQPK
jgi:hypothetical protein